MFSQEVTTPFHSTVIGDEHSVLQGLAVSPPPATKRNVGLRHLLVRIADLPELTPRFGRGHRNAEKSGGQILKNVAPLPLSTRREWVGTLWPATSNDGTSSCSRSGKEEAFGVNGRDMWCNGAGGLKGLGFRF